MKVDVFQRLKMSFENEERGARKTQCWSVTIARLEGWAPWLPSRPSSRLILGKKNYILYYKASLSLKYVCCALCLFSGNKSVMKICRIHCAHQRAPIIWVSTSLWENYIKEKACDRSVVFRWLAPSRSLRDNNTDPGLECSWIRMH